MFTLWCEMKVAQVLREGDESPGQGKGWRGPLWFAECPLAREILRHLSEGSILERPSGCCCPYPVWKKEADLIIFSNLSVLPSGF